MSRRTDLAITIASTSIKNGVSNKYAQEIAAYILDNRLTNEVESLLRDIQADWATNGHLEVLAYSAHPLSNSIKDEIRQQVKKTEPGVKTIVVTEIEDPEVIGGVRISLPGRQLDLSVEAKLNKFKSLVSSGKE